ncbi:hypothetical protein [Streptomyces sp. NPDC055692]|uniref:hypothetical protein n=1 Tax=Streptomyces sp. NPDC055692 TaxID=3155683 RepID=UPI003445DEDD
MLLSAGVALTAVPDGMTEERAYQAARPCGAAVTEDCLRSVQATVRGTQVRRESKSTRRELLLTGPGVPREVSMEHYEPLFEHLRAGDAVTVTMWRDYAIAVHKDGVTQYSNNSPEGGAVFLTATVLLVIPIGLYAVYTGGHAVARAPHYAATGLPARLGRTLQPGLAVLCAVPAGLFGIWTGPVGVIVLWLVLVGVMLVATRGPCDAIRRPGRTRGHAFEVTLQGDDGLV